MREDDMREKDDAAKEKILEYAKAEFMERGYADASMRAIAERSGCTTGMLYSRFADKDEIFRELVESPAEELYNYFVAVQDDFAARDPEFQRTQMHAYVDAKIGRMADIIYDNFDAFKLIVCKSNGSSYEFYIDRMVDIETKNTFRFIELLRSQGIRVNEIRKDFAHMLSSALFNGMFEVVAHDLSKEDALHYIGQLQRFFNAGWDVLLGL